MPSVVYRSEAENFKGLLPDESGRKPCKQRSSRSNPYMLFNDCEAKLDKVMENRGIWLEQAEKDLNRSVKI